MNALRMALLAGAVIAGVPLAGCDWAMPGTTAAYTKCVQSLKAQNLDDNAAKISCLASNQVSINRGLTGEAHIDSSTNRSLDASVTNDSTDLVITSYEVSVSLPNGKHASKVFRNRFLQPGQTEDAVLLPFEMSDFQAADFTNDAGNKPTWTWNAQPLTGLTISSSGGLL
jgi:hypothetical protein